MSTQEDIHIGIIIYQAIEEYKYIRMRESHFNLCYISKSGIRQWDALGAVLLYVERDTEI